MASILDLYKKSNFAKLPNAGGDKTPISVDGGKDLSNEQTLAKARGGKLNEKKYSDTVSK